MTTYTIYGSTADYSVSSTNATWATARAGSSLSASAVTNTLEYIGVDTPGDYWVYQLFLAFDTSACISGTASAVSIKVSAYPYFTDTFEIAESAWTSGTASFVPGANLGALTQFGSVTITAFVDGQKTFSSSLTTIPVSSAYKLVLYSALQRNSTAPGYAGASDWVTADNSGTTDDPVLTFTVTAGAAAGGVYRSPSFSAIPLLIR